MNFNVESPGLDSPSLDLNLPSPFFLPWPATGIRAATAAAVFRCLRMLDVWPTLIDRHQQRYFILLFGLLFLLLSVFLVVSLDT